MPEVTELENHISRIEATLMDKATQIGEEKYKELTGNLAALQKQYADMFDKLEKQQQAYDQLDMKVQRGKLIEEKDLNVQQSISKAVGDNFEKIKSDILDNRQSAIQVKATMTTGTSYTGTNPVVLPDQLPGIYSDPFADPTRARNLVSQGATGSNSVSFVQAGAPNPSNNSYQNQVEGQLKQEYDTTFSATERSVRTLAAILVITKQMLDDQQGLQAFISNMLTQRMANNEDIQILNGDNTSEKLDGLFNNAPAANVTMTGATATNPQEVDAIRVGILQLRLLQYTPTAILLNPTDYYNILGLKDTQSQYLQPGFSYQNGVLRLYGFPVLNHVNVPRGIYLAGNFQQAAQYLIREGLSLRFFEQDSDNVRRNLITARIEMRSVLAVVQPGALVQGDFASLITDLT